MAQHQLAYKYKVALCIQGSVPSANGTELVAECIVKYTVNCMCIYLYKLFCATFQFILCSETRKARMEASNNFSTILSTEHALLLSLGVHCLLNK